MDKKSLQFNLKKLSKIPRWSEVCNDSSSSRLGIFDCLT